MMMEVLQCKNVDMILLTPTPSVTFPNFTFLSVTP